MQRMQARDFYDIWYLLEKQDMNVDFYLNEFEAKCKKQRFNAYQFPEKTNRTFASIQKQVAKLYE